MEINIMSIIVIIVISGLCYWVNEKLNTIPMLKTIVQVLIVVVAVLLLLQSFGIMGNSTHIRIN